MNLPFWPFYVGDYLADTMHLNVTEHGVYLLLMMAYWKRQGPLPDNDADLANIAKLSPPDWGAIRGRIAPFFQIKGGFWNHKRIDSDIQKQRNRYLAMSQGGMRGNKKRWGSPPDSGSVSPPDSPPVSQPEPEPEPDRRRGVPPNPPSREIPTEQQAIAMTMTCAIPEDFCRYVYADWSTREGRDGANCPVCWLPYVKKRWEREKMAWAARTHNGNKEAKANGAVRSVMDLRTVLMAKETLATQIRERYSSNSAVGVNWNDETKRQEYRTLRREIGEITRQIAGMA